MKKRARNRLPSLIHAVQRCNLPLVRRLITACAIVNICDSEGHTALMCASAKGRTGVVRLLLKHGTDSSIESVYPGVGWASAMSIAAHQGHLNVVCTLLPRNRRPSRTRWVRSPDVFRVFERQPIMKREIEHRDDQRYNSEPAFLRFVALVHATEGKQTAVIALLKPHRDYGLHTHKIASCWLVQAVEFNDIDSVKFWLDFGVEIDTPTSWGQGETALIEAAKDGNIEMVRLLLSRGADIHAKTDYGYSVFDALEPPPDHYRTYHPDLYQRLLSLMPAREEIRRLLQEHLPVIQTAVDTV